MFTLLLYLLLGLIVFGFLFLLTPWLERA